MNRIIPPTTQMYPDRFLQCQEAMTGPFTDVALSAVNASWNPEEIAAAIVVMSNGDAGEKLAHLGAEITGISFWDYLGHRDDEIIVGDDGTASFPVHGGSVSVWVRENVFDRAGTKHV